MTKISAVGIHDNFPAGQPGVSGRSAHHKFSGGIDVDMIYIPHIKIIAGQYRSDDHFFDILTQIFNGKFRAMHNGDHDGFHAGWPTGFVKFYRDLRFAIRTQIGVFLNHLREPVG